MRARAHHLHDERLFDCYLAESTGEPVDPPAAEHLADCSRCSARYAELRQSLDAVRVEGIVESDAVFTPERLQAQQQQIARRIAHVGHAARVLSFPSQFVSRRVAGSTSRVAMRWIAAAAAVGLFVGMAAGMFLDNTHGRGVSVGQLASVRRIDAPSPHAGRLRSPRTGVASDTADDAFLSELDSALDRPYTRELAPLDALTPHVREVTNQVR
ncbi:MAG: hypothetical protein ACM3SQ_08845 [Betaproteobacteria bacterium]